MIDNQTVNRHKASAASSPSGGPSHGVTHHLVLVIRQSVTWVLAASQDATSFCVIAYMMLGDDMDLVWYADDDMLR